MQTQTDQSESGSQPASSALQPTASLVAAPSTNERSTTGIKPPDVGAIKAGDEIEFLWKFSEATHRYISEYIRLADQKAFFFFAGATALLTLLHKSNLAYRWFKLPKLWDLADMLSFIGTTGLVISTIACLVTVLPRLKGSKRGLIYFGAIGEFESAREYVSEVLSNRSSDLVEAKLRHVYELSKICKRKYRVLLWGQFGGAIGVVMTMLLLIFIR